MSVRPLPTTRQNPLSLSVRGSSAATHEVVQFYPSCGRLSPGGDHWQVAVQGRVVTPRPDNIRKSVMLRLFRRALQASADQLQSPVFQQRISDFLMLVLRDRQITAQIGNRLYPLKRRSKIDGYFNGSIRIPRVETALRIDPNERNAWIEFTHALHHPTWEAGQAQLIAPSGPSIISDIDDTLKITNVARRRELLANTFFHPFQPIDGMAAQYRTWALSGSVVHYVSASPWQLFRPLRDFLHAEGFPQGSFHLRSIRLQGTGTLKLLLTSKRAKKKSVRNLLRRFPHRKFLLIGDSGELDPEIYGWAARRFPSQVEQVCIRRLGKLKRKRLKRVFRNVPKSKWRIFESPEELADIRCVAEAGWQF